MEKKTSGGYVNIGGREYYEIDEYDRLEPFLYTLAASNDIWFYLASSGAVTAGRKNAEQAYFPYQTEDRLYHCTDTGSVTLIRVTRGGKSAVWEPFSTSPLRDLSVHRKIAKSVLGDEVIITEENPALGMTFTMKWCSCERYGIVRSAEIRNDGEPASVEVLDGLRNILPYGVRSEFQLAWPCLGDAYKATEQVGENTAVFSLTSAINDLPEPEEALRANVAWCIAPFEKQLLLSERAIEAFMRGEDAQAGAAYGERGCFLLRFEFTAASGSSRAWKTVSDVSLGQDGIARIAAGISESELETEILRSREELRSIIARADGLQCTGNRASTYHHMSNVMFNNMRGGLFMNGYDVSVDDFIGFLRSHNRPLADEKSEAVRAALGEHCTVAQLHEFGAQSGDPDLHRLTAEYLPISFSRRHGDPSRPWNRFNIILKNEDGTPRTYYEGNWRDIFQNWEAMCMSFPEYLPSVISVFLDSSSPDGYNPYRVTRDGIDWEGAEPGNPNSSQGYWGDHQIVYLCRLLEALSRYDRAALDTLMASDCFTYADIPYRIADFDRMISDPKDTIELDAEKNRRLRAESAELGGDYRLLRIGGRTYTATFAEKLSIPIAAKLSYLVLGGGVWMNTRRPEWNDANNAIVGYGLSVVTTAQLRRHLALCRELFAEHLGESFVITEEVCTWLRDLTDLLERYIPLAERELTPALRYDALRATAEAFDRYKSVVYAGGFSGRRTEMGYAELCKLFELGIRSCDLTLAACRAEDGLFHSYNLLHRNGESIEISRLFPMLEGQVAVLGSGYLSAEESRRLIRAMYASPLYSERNRTFYLYPIRMSTPFTERGILGEDEISESALLTRLLSDGNTDIVVRCADGIIRFAPAMISAAKLNAALSALPAEYRSAAESERDALLALYERHFRHYEFTGRSQIMYGYEGIGSIYWHQNSKLLVSIQEAYLAAHRNGDGAENALRDEYYLARSGLGFCKEPDDWGAFPQDAYSHTPLRGGARQPGMTGQVKEEIITRFAELGVLPEGGRLTFDPSIVQPEEFLTEPDTFRFVRTSGESEELSLEPGTLGFTVCQTPVIYRSGMSGTKIFYSDGTNKQLLSTALGSEDSHDIFGRSGRIVRVEVGTEA